MRSVARINHYILTRLGPKRVCAEPDVLCNKMQSIYAHVFNIYSTD